MYDPSIGQESLTLVDIVGVIAGHIIFGIAATLLLDWSWIPLSPLQKKSGRSLKELKTSWGWDEKPNQNLDSSDKDNSGYQIKKNNNNE